jgi:hypothetical protein
MAMNLRLRPEAEEALKRAAQSAGRSQQDLIRDAVDQYLRRAELGYGGDLADLYASGALIPGTPLRHPTVRLTLPEGVTSLDLLDREDRF